MKVFSLWLQHSHDDFSFVFSCACPLQPPKHVLEQNLMGDQKMYMCIHIYTKKGSYLTRPVDTHHGAPATPSIQGTAGSTDAPPARPKKLAECTQVVNKGAMDDTSPNPQILCFPGQLYHPWRCTAGNFSFKQNCKHTLLRTKMYKVFAWVCWDDTDDQRLRKHVWKSSAPMDK